MTPNGARSISAIAMAASVCAIAGSPDARTWYVKVDGTGDAPSIAAAMDSAISNDTVLVADGTYEIAYVRVKEGVVLLSEHGPHVTRLVPEPFTYPYTALICSGFEQMTVIEGFWIDGFIWGDAGDGAINVGDCGDLYIRHNVFTNNEAAGVALYGDTSPTFIYLESNTFVTHEPSAYTIIADGESGFISNNILWGRAYGLGRVYILECNCMLETDDAWGSAPLNFELDPQFCGTTASGNLFLQSDSPCAPGNTPPPHTDGCQSLIGALPVGCGTTPVEYTTWGRI